MASNIKGITIQIGGDTTGLDKALRNVNKETKNVQYELKEVEKSLKLDPKNTEVLAQKQKLLGDAVKATKDKLDALRDVQKQLLAEVEKGTPGAQEAYNKVTRQASDAAAEFKKAEKAAKDFGSVKLQELSAQLDGVSSKAGAVANATKGLSAVAGGVVGGIGAMALKSAAAADDLNTLSKQSGLTTDELQRMQYASDLVDVSMDDMVGAQSRLRKSMAGNGDAFRELGVSVVGVDGQMRDSSEVFYEVLEALSHVENGTKRDQLAMDIFGKSADSLAGIIDDGGAALKSLGDEAENLGLVLDQDTLNSMNEVNDSVDRLKAKMNGELARAGATALQTLTPVFEQIIDAIGRVLEWIGNLDSSTIMIIATVGTAVAAISPVAGAISNITKAASDLMKVWPQIKTAAAGVSTFLASNPMMLIAAAVAAAVILIIANWDKIKPVLEEVWNKVKEVAGKVVDAIKGAVDKIRNAMRAVRDAVKNVWDTIVDGIKDAFQKVKDAFQSIKDFFVDIWTKIVDTVKEKINAVIEFVNKGIEAINTFTQKINSSKVGNALGFNIGQIGSIPALASGGILSSGSALVGESGPEILTMDQGRAVVQPLTTNNYNTTTTNNYGVSRQPIQLVLDGKVAAQALYDPLQDIGRNRGPQFAR